jgi:hypothetical protein
VSFSLLGLAAAATGGALLAAGAVRAARGLQRAGSG